MAGNVWEWCLNKYDGPKAIEADRSGYYRVLRGGTWHGSARFARAAYRDYFGAPSYRYYDIGFRVCCVSPIVE